MCWPVQKDQKKKEGEGGRKGGRDGRGKSIQMGKKKLKLSLFADNVSAYIRWNLQKSC